MILRTAGPPLSWMSLGSRLGHLAVRLGRCSRERSRLVCRAGLRFLKEKVGRYVMQGDYAALLVEEGSCFT